MRAMHFLPEGCRGVWGLWGPPRLPPPKKIAREGKLAKLATLPKEEEYQNLDIGGVLKISNFANSLSLAILPVLVAIFSLPVA